MKLICALASITLALSMTSVAIAQDSVTDAYGGQSTNIPSSVVTPPAAGENVTPAKDITPVEATTDVPTVAGATATRPASAPSAGSAPVAVATPSASQPVSDSALPFTGLDVGLMALGGLLLLGFGLGMRRLSQRTAPLA